jgi:hypothetical protein
MLKTESFLSKHFAGSEKYITFANRNQSDTDYHGGGYNLKAVWT